MTEAEGTQYLDQDVQQDLGGVNVDWVSGLITRRKTMLHYGLAGPNVTLDCWAYASHNGNLFDLRPSKEAVIRVVGGRTAACGGGGYGIGYRSLLQYLACLHLGGLRWTTVARA